MEPLRDSVIVVVGAHTGIEKSIIEGLTGKCVVFIDEMEEIVENEISEDMLKALANIPVTVPVMIEDWLPKKTRSKSDRKRNKRKRWGGGIP